jgi:hypothetical protein
MNGAASFELAAVEDAAQILDYFNGFHDGFIQRMVIESQDRINQDLSQTCSGVFDVEMEIAHYNYPAAAGAFHPYDQIVRARFRGVQDIVCDFRREFLGNTIIALSFAAANRRKGGATTLESCLSLRVARHFYLEEERRYELKECELFTFTTASFVEPAVGDSRPLE